MATLDLQPTLTGPRVLIRPVVEADYEAMFAAATDPKIWELHPVINRYTEPVFREFFDGAITSGSAFTLVDRQTEGVIGSSRYYGHDSVAREIEIGWTFLTREYWGGSYNAEVKDLMLDHAFDFVDTVAFWVGETNWRSRRAMEKIGGVLRQGIHQREQGSHVVYEIGSPRIKGP